MAKNAAKQELTPSPALKQKRWWGGILISLGGIMATVGIAYAFLNIAGDLLPIFLGILFAYVGIRLFNRGRRHFVQVGLAALQKDPRPPVLYLRPFSEDGATGQVSPNAINREFIEKGAWRQAVTVIRFLDTYEQYIGFAFRKIGPFVAIGIPSEGLPQLGAIRVYVGPEGDWQHMVSELAAKASYVLLQIGASDGLMWEVEYTVNHVRPEQLILCLPNPRIRITRLSGPKKREINRQKIYQAFRDKTKTFFPSPLPEKIGGAMFIYFDHGWQPRLSRFQSEPILSFRRPKVRFDDPKLKALNWLNSVLH